MTLCGVLSLEWCEHRMYEGDARGGGGGVVGKVKSLWACNALVGSLELTLQDNKSRAKRFWTDKWRTPSVSQEDGVEHDNASEGRRQDSRQERIRENRRKTVRMERRWGIQEALWSRLQRTGKALEWQHRGRVGFWRGSWVFSMHVLVGGKAIHQGRKILRFLTDQQSSSRKRKK